MILCVSGRTDIPAFYSEWFMNRYHEGFVDVRNPFNPKLVSRINFKNVDAILFISKNPSPLIPYLKEIDKPMLFHITLTPYKRDIEPNIPDKSGIIESIKEISKCIGKEYVTVRFDPVFISDAYPIEYHIKAFERVCELLDGYVSKILISFIDDYKNVRKNLKEIRYRELREEDYKRIGEAFSKSAHAHGMIVHTCFEDRNLSEYGFEVDDCLSHEVAFQLTGKKYPEWTARKGRKCHCVQMVDIGSYNTCKHFCKYCYANYDELQVNANRKLHNPKSTLLIGELEPDDVIKERVK